MGIMEKIEHYKDLQRYYRARGEPTVLPSFYTSLTIPSGYCTYMCVQRATAKVKILQ